MPLRLHDYVLSAESYAVRLMLALLGRSYERVAVDVHPGGGESPILETDDGALRDPGLILTYLVRLTGTEATWLPAEKAGEIAHWLAFAATALRPLSEARLVATLGLPGDLAALNAKGRLALRTVDDALTDRRLAGEDWLCGSTPTLADIAVFPSVMLSHDSGLGHEPWPAINLWQRRVRRLPGFIGMPGIPDYF